MHAVPPPPRNLPGSHIRLYPTGPGGTPRAWTPQRVRPAVITKQGAVFRRWRLMDASIPAASARIQQHARRLAWFNRLRRPLLRLQDDVPRNVLHDLWALGGYYHWVTSSLFRHAALGEAAANHRLVMPEQAGNAGFVQAALHCLPHAGIDTYPDNRNLWVPQLTLVPDLDIGNDPDPALMQQVRAWFRVPAAPLPPEAGRKVYISRAKASRRKLLDEDTAVLPLVRDAGFEVHCFEDLSAEQQLALLRETTQLASIHGAGLANLVFMPPGGSVLELIADPLVLERQNFYPHNFWQLAHAAGHRYYVQFCRPEDPAHAFDQANLRVDPAQLRQNLQQLDAEASEAPATQAR